MKKCMMLFLMYICVSSSAYCASDNFLNIINIMGIERYNISGYEINEYIYYTYNQIVYGSPEDAIYEPTQRWKNVSNGNWIRNGNRGEYRLLGYNNIGKVINNHEFPNDITPLTSPLEWRYAILDDAMDSWKDISRYKFIKQKEYMLNTNLLRDNIEYDLTTNTIGLDKVRLDNCSTWKTKGTVYTNRYDYKNKKWEATFNTKPIAVDVSFTNYITPKLQTMTMFKTNNYIDITVNWGAIFNTDSEYISKEQIKKIESSIYVNNGLVTTFEITKEMGHSGSYGIRMYRGEFPKVYYLKMNTVNLMICSKLYTEFITDTPMYAISYSNINVWVQDGIGKAYIVREKYMSDEYVIPSFTIPVINSNVDPNISNSINVEMKKIVKENSDYYVEDIYKTNSTDSGNSIGVISSGNEFVLKVTGDSISDVTMSIIGDNSIKTLDNKTKLFEWIEPRQRNTATRYNSLDEYYSFYNINTYNFEEYNNSFYFSYLIPYGTIQTLHSWNSIRDAQGNSFNIDKSLLFSRISNPYMLNFEICRQYIEDTEDGFKIYTTLNNEYIKFDVFESWNNLYNRDVTKYINNKVREKIRYNDWKNI